MGQAGKKRKQRKKQKRSGRPVKEDRTKTALACYRELSKVFGDLSSAMLRLASDGASPEEIAKRLDISVETADKFIERFEKLPHGYIHLLLNAPGLLSKRSQMTSMLRSAINQRKSSG